MKINPTGKTRSRPTYARLTLLAVVLWATPFFHGCDHQGTETTFGFPFPHFVTNADLQILSARPLVALLNFALLALTMRATRSFRFHSVLTSNLFLVGLVFLTFAYIALSWVLVIPNMLLVMAIVSVTGENVAYVGFLVDSLVRLELVTLWLVLFWWTRASLPTARFTRPAQDPEWMK